MSGERRGGGRLHERVSDEPQDESRVARLAMAQAHAVVHTSRGPDRKARGQRTAAPLPAGCVPTSPRVPDRQRHGRPALRPGAMLLGREFRCLPALRDSLHIRLDQGSEGIAVPGAGIGRGRIDLRLDFRYDDLVRATVGLPWLNEQQGGDATVCQAPSRIASVR